MSDISETVLAITQDLFTAMVDGEPGLLTAWPGDPVELADPVHAWVDVHADEPVRAVVSTDLATAELLSRALLAMDLAEPVAPEDLRDAFGEVANVVGGNLKGLMSAGGTLTLPVVAHGASGLTGAPAWECRLQWRTEPLVISMWHLTAADPEGTL